MDGERDYIYDRRMRVLDSVWSYPCCGHTVSSTIRRTTTQQASRGPRGCPPHEPYSQHPIQRCTGYIIYPGYRIRPTAAPCFLSVLRVPQHPRRDAAPTQGHLLESTEACRRSVQTIARGRGGSIFYFEPIFNKLLISYIYNIGCYLLRK